MERSTDREKVIKGLEQIIWEVDNNSMWLPGDDDIRDAITLLKEQEDTINELQNAYGYLQKQFFEAQDKLLKEQEHSETFIVIDTKTGKEADEYEIALHEDWAKHLCYCDMDGWAIMDDGSLLLVDECGKYAYADRERFKVKWE